VRRFLHIDEETRELRLVITDLADGMHERTEFRVLGSGGRVLRGMERWGHLDGVAVASDRTGSELRYYCAPRARVHPAIAYPSERIYFEVEPRAVGITEKVRCPRATNRRRRCERCRAEERIVEAANAQAARRTE
jgi:hypothetical protein